MGWTGLVYIEALLRGLASCYSSVSSFILLYFSSGSALKSFNFVLSWAHSIYYLSRSWEHVFTSLSLSMYGEGGGKGNLKIVPVSRWPDAIVLDLDIQMGRKSVQRPFYFTVCEVGVRRCDALEVDLFCDFCQPGRYIYI